MLAQGRGRRTRDADEAAAERVGRPGERGDRPSTARWSTRRPAGSLPYGQLVDKAAQGCPCRRIRSSRRPDQFTLHRQGDVGGATRPPRSTAAASTASTCRCPGMLIALDRALPRLRREGARASTRSARQGGARREAGRAGRQRRRGGGRRLLERRCRGGEALEDRVGRRAPSPRSRARASPRARGAVEAGRARWRERTATSTRRWPRGGKVVRGACTRCRSSSTRAWSR